MPKATDDNTASPDAQLLRACAAFWAAQQRLDHLQATSPRAPFGDPRTVEFEGQIDRVDGLRSAAVRAAAKLPALTPEGLRAKALVVSGSAAIAAARADVAAPAPAADTGQDTELIRLCQQFHRQHAEMEAIPGNRWDELGNAAVEARANTRDLIKDMPAITDRGRSAKASVAVLLLVEYGEPGVPQFALATLRDVAGGA